MANTFDGVLCFAFLAALLVLGTVIRAKVPALQRSLLPASLIGGGIGFLLVTFDLALGYQARDFSAFAFHFFTLSFMSLVLTGKPKSAKEGLQHCAGRLVALSHLGGKPCRPSIGRLCRHPNL
jgi:ESS family glutamate:Na+ symporter